MRNHYNDCANNAIEEIKSVMNSMIEKYKVRNKLNNNGAIFYRNGNDGTAFDWRCNDRTCEFYTFFDEEPKMGFCKITAEKDGMLRVWVYPNGENEPSEEFAVAMGEDDTFYLACLLYKIADNLLLWDEDIKNLNFDFELTESYVDDFRFLTR